MAGKNIDNVEVPVNMNLYNVEFTMNLDNVEVKIDNVEVTMNLNNEPKNIDNVEVPMNLDNVLAASRPAGSTTGCP